MLCIPGTLRCARNDERSNEPNENGAREGPRPYPEQ